jgi:hypothetical protein
MPAKKRQPLANPIMVRMEHAMKEDIERIATANALTASDVVRLAVRRSLPSLKNSRVTLQGS